MTNLKKLLAIAMLLILHSVVVSAQTFNVATYNLRNDNKGDVAQGDGWVDRRLPVVAALIRFHGFDVFGTQEGFYHQLTGLKSALPGYDFTGVGRDDGKQGGEHSAIFYNSKKFDLLEHGDFWLSQDPTKPNKGWDAVLPRICSWAKLQVKGTKKSFYFFNIHFDHVGVEARKESAKLILSKVKEMAKNHSAILTGDFNVDQHNESYLLLDNSGVLKDAFEKAEFKYAVNGTFNNFNPNTKTESRIDHIFLTDDFAVSKYGILTDTYRSPIKDKEEEYRSGNFPKEVSLKDYRARMPSDHFPVMVTVSFK
ncbi:Metal-dependent hydrolase, endonuclease/exonuclease/phosphatase family [Pedobacter antarcticus]|uniref:Metal-dependent hydrolase, endonuclease/exonuclease/phosphatase family n=2 Tax=Pedobacter antarcticus TaxID=34086 RepID=A0A1I2IW31_9SPHI|nr:endonuclease/exonuclease/phosphatase family protein [Pedobacter antarcticus]SDM54892.1 Metal-dependent hydrolase, endonuclease/exonuclease/phosphatase family [Pedobacter antarcticus]SFF45898.1 Metal-dependent hydrolase, endonuclease/exonuclease/phosphatase family [Pedobacter antarcticus]